MGVVINVPWYATGFRADALEDELAAVSAYAPRYGASAYTVYRSRDDRYRFMQILHFESKVDWQRFWEGPEMTDFRVRCSSYYQVPVLYGTWDLSAHASVSEEAAGNGAPLAWPTA